MIRIDGTMGEGGGQVLRTSLALSALTGTPFEIVDIRGRRPKPGLQRQHLTCVKAAAAVCDAYVDGAELGSGRLRFEPNQARSGVWSWAIGSAGSANLVAQTVLPILIGRGASTVTIEGGTHNPMAPTSDFLETTFAPVLANFGVQLNVVTEKHGFFPAGGGKLRIEVDGSFAKPAHFLERGALIDKQIIAASIGLPYDVAKREVSHALQSLAWPESHGQAKTWRSVGVGNVVSATLAFQNITEHFTSLGQRGLNAEVVAERLVREINDYLAHTAPVGPHLADQLMIPIALAGGSFITYEPSLHTRTQVELIPLFLDVDFRIEDRGNQVLIESVTRSL